MGRKCRGHGRVCCTNLCSCCRDIWRPVLADWGYMDAAVVTSADSDSVCPGLDLGSKPCGF
jgi:hypothetical protein